MPASAPPALPGYDFLRGLGHGGFADVYLYRQHLPSREVAVKVLRTPARTDDERTMFEQETNRMAALSSHPGIVTIYEAGVAPDGRPFLTMELCPHDHFGNLVRARPLSVSRALEVGIKVAAAVETAHRASILHRDLKPANILLTAYDEPALTDFGIAGGAGDDVVHHGVSIPFAAPEVLRGATGGDELSDVYSLGATVYALLAGRSPFSTGTPLGDAALMQRVLNEPLPPTGRADLPASLERALATAMAREPANRYDSPAAFGRALQAIEGELGLAQTPLRIADPSSVPPPPRDPGDDDRTRFRSVPRVDPDGPTAASTTRPPVAAPTPTAPPARESTVDAWAPATALPDTGLGDRTVHRAGAEPAPADEAPAETEPSGPDVKRIGLIVGGGVVLLVVVALLITRVGGSADDAAATTTTTPSSEPLVLGDPLQRPERVRVEQADGGGQVVTWSAPKAAKGDTYQVTITDGPAALRGTTELVEERTLSLDTDRRVCVIVEAIRKDKVSGASTEVCSR